MNFRRFVLGLICAAWPALAFGPSLATSPPEMLLPAPEIRAEMDGLNLRARLVHSGRKDLAFEVVPGQAVDLQVAIKADKKAKDRLINLNCRVRFVGPYLEFGKPVFNGKCLEINRSKLVGKWTALPVGMTFRPRPSDTVGLWAVEVSVIDGKGHEVLMTATYDWKGKQ